MVKPIVVGVVPHHAAGDGGGDRARRVDVPLGVSSAAAQARPCEAQPIGHGPAGDLVRFIETIECVGEVIHGWVERC